jgi:hypothetical protein
MPEKPLHPWAGVPEWQVGALPPERDRIDEEKVDAVGQVAGASWRVRQE